MSFIWPLHGGRRVLWSEDMPRPPDSRLELCPEVSNLPPIPTCVRPSYRSTGMLGDCRSSSPQLFISEDSTIATTHTTHTLTRWIHSGRSSGPSGRARRRRGRQKQQSSSSNNKNNNKATRMSTTLKILVWRSWRPFHRRLLHRHLCLRLAHPHHRRVASTRWESSSRRAH